MIILHKQKIDQRKVDIHNKGQGKILHESQNKKPEELKQFERYHYAVNADRYRVTCIHMFDDDTKKTFILDKRNGETKGFTPQEIEQRTPEMQRLRRRGENIYYTPLSTKLLKYPMNGPPFCHGGMRVS